MSPERTEDFALGFLREWGRLDDHSPSSFIKVLERVKKIA